MHVLAESPRKVLTALPPLAAPKLVPGVDLDAKASTLAFSGEHMDVPTVRRFPQPLEAQRGPRAVPQQALQRIAIPCPDHCTGMQAVPRVCPGARVPPGSPGRRTHQNPQSRQGYFTKITPCMVDA